MRALPPRRLRGVLALAVVAAVAMPLVGAQAVTPARPAPVGHLGTTYTPFVGALHAHSAYSDGYPNTNPGVYYASGKSHGLDFLMGSDHSNALALPLTASEQCLGPGVVDCPGGDSSNPAGTATKWPETQKYADAATTASFSAVRGFEWTSDRYGHINVYFSKNYANAKADNAGYVSMTAFYEWLNRRPELQGGGDGIATFNHPGDKDLPGAPQAADLNWNDFAYDAASDDRMVGIELYNSGEEKDINGASAPPGGYYAHALDKGWHLGPVGAEDLGHDPGDDWGNRSSGGTVQAKTIILATDRSPAALKAAMLARRFYASFNRDVRLDWKVDGNVMGSRLSRPAGSGLSMTGTASWPGHPGLTLEVVTSGGAVVGSGTDSITMTRPVTAAEKYYFLRVKSGSAYVGYSSPVWVGTAERTAVGEWLAGDLHVHTCNSHDVYCGPDDDNTGPEDFYTAGGTVEERFLEASARGLDYLAITDHQRPESVDDPGFGTHGVVGVPGYENSISGHAQMLGATKVYPYGSADSKTPAGIAGANAMADALRADGGVFRANHPEDDLDHELVDCADTGNGDGPRSWRYGYDVRVDSVEVWNVSHLIQPPLPGNSPNKDNIRFWECWLDRGAHVAATGGSDSHWLSTSAVQGVGNPTTWVYARERSARGVLQAIREGRTSISLNPPTEGAGLLLLEADRDGDGDYESMLGDTVPPGTPMRVRATGLPGAGLVEVLANDAVLLDEEPLTPGGAVEFTAPNQAGWVYARLLTPESVETRRSICDQQVGDQTTYCRAPVGVLAMTSAMYLGDVAPSADVPEVPLTWLLPLAMVATLTAGVGLARRRAG